MLLCGQAQQHAYQHGWRVTSYLFSTVTLGLGGTVVRLEANSQKSANCNPQEEQRNEIYPISRS